MSAEMKSWQSAWDIPAHVYNKYRQSCYPKEQRTCKRFRVRGQHVLHGKYVLMLVVALCILDCCLVITELILDIHAVKDAIDTQHLSDTMAHDDDYHQNTDNATNANFTNQFPPNYHVTERNPTAAHNVHRRAASAGGHDIPLTMKIAHACHFASVAILGVLLVYVLLKVLFFGKEMFGRKLEMFDAFVVLASFALDLAFLDGLTNGPIENTAFILSFFVPWRVLRVVNSLVVAILDHEHYKLVLIYKSKKRVEQTLDEVREELHEATNRIKKIKEVALQNGVDEWKLNLSLVQAQKHDGKKHALSSFASFTFGAMAVKKGADKFNVRRLSKIPQTENTKSETIEEKTNGVARKGKVIEAKNNDNTILDNTEADSPKSISGDSALSLSLDAEQNDITIRHGNELENFTEEDIVCSTQNTLSTESSKNAKESVISANGQIMPTDTENKETTESIDKTETLGTGDHVTVVNIPENLDKNATVVNIPENLDKNFDRKPDHSNIQITFSEPHVGKTNVKHDRETIGHDNTAFEDDNSNTKL